MDIRRYRTDDPAEQQAVLAVLRLGLQEQEPYTGEENYADRTLERLETSLVCGMDDWWVAIGHEGSVVGVMAMKVDYGDQETVGRHSLLTEIDVLREARRTGIARKLVTKAEEVAKAADMGALLSSTHAGNGPSRCFHARCGFVPVPDALRPPDDSGLVAFVKYLA